MTTSDFNAILPLLVLSGWASLLLLVDLWIPKNHKGITAFLALLGLAVTLAVEVIIAYSLPGVAIPPSSSRRMARSQPMIGWMPDMEAYWANSSAPNRLLRSVTATAGIDCALASATTVSILFAPSVSEYADRTLR